MRSGGNNFHYFNENKLTKLANLVQFKRKLMFCLGPLLPLFSSLCLWGGKVGHVGYLRFLDLGPRTRTPRSGSATVHHRRRQKGMTDKETGKQTNLPRIIVRFSWDCF